MKLYGKIVHIAGSASKGANLELISYGHRLIRKIVRELLDKGAKFLVQVGGEPVKEENQTNIPLIFDWTVLLEIRDYLVYKGLDFTNSSEKPIITIVKQDFSKSIPAQREELWRDLMNKEAIRMEFLEEGWSSGAIRRNRMSEYGDILILISGGEGVEHLAVEYNHHNKPIIPLDLVLGASSEDGGGGAAKLFSKMLRHYEPFMNVKEPASVGDAFFRIRTNNGTTPIDNVSKGVIELIDKISPPIAFYVRLMNKKNTKYRNVDEYFRNIVDPLIIEKGYTIKEIGTQESSYAWMNVEIFESLHRAAIAVVDLTGLRSNCFMELGYALGKPTKVLLTAENGTKLPFDAQMYECLFWDASEDDNVKKSKLNDYFERNFNRPPIVRDKDAL